MKSHNALENQVTRRSRPLAVAAALAAAVTLSLTPLAHAEEIVVPPVPTDLEPPAGSVAFLVGHAVGTQNYVCLPTDNAANRVAWTLFTPEATLFDDGNQQLITHFFSPNPNPIENGTIRAAWQDSRDTSTVWAGLVAPSTDPAFVEEGAIAWLLLARVGSQEGPTGGNALTQTTHIQRLNTHGGLAPSTGCSRSKDVGKKAFMPYTADYFFYKAAPGDVEGN